MTLRKNNDSAFRVYEPDECGRDGYPQAPGTYLGEDLTRAETEARMDELLALELAVPDAA